MKFMIVKYNHTCTDTWNYQNNSTVIALGSIILIYSVLRLVLEFIQLVISLYQAYSSLQCGKQFCWDLLGAVKEVNYIWDLFNWVEVPLLVLSIIFSIIVFSKKKTFCLLAWQWQIGVTAVSYTHLTLPTIYSV